MASSTTLTIAEIARLAGVGTATVDRVINGRPGVNAETMAKVMQVISQGEESARPLGRPRQDDGLRFAFVLPDGDSPFFDAVERQVAQVAGDFRHQHITTVIYRLSADDSTKFAADLSQVDACDGVALLAVDVPVIKRAIGDLVRAGVHVVTLFSDVAGSARQLFVGADNRAAGRTAGLLLGNMAGTPGKDVMLLLSQSTRLSSEIERRIGFVQVLEDSYPTMQIVRITDLPKSDDAVCEALLGHLQHEIDPTRLAGVYMVGQGTTGLMRALAQSGLKGTLGVVVHDLTELHTRYLTRGEASYLLHQDIHYCVLNAASVLRKLCANARGALHVAQPRIEILTAENLR